MKTPWLPIAVVTSVGALMAALVCKPSLPALADVPAIFAASLLLVWLLSPKGD